MNKQPSRGIMPLICSSHDLGYLANCHFSHHHLSLLLLLLLFVADELYNTILLQLGLHCQNMAYIVFENGRYLYRVPAGRLSSAISPFQFWGPSLLGLCQGPNLFIMLPMCSLL